MSLSFAAFTEELRTRLSRGVLSMLAPENPALRAELERRLGGWPGEPDALLAPPVFEHRFDYPRHTDRMADLARSGFLNRTLITGLDGATPRFPADRRPYVHQVEAWRALKQADARSVVVSTGTGSGKTECFLIPLLDSLADEAAREPGPLVGVRALLLYPLNALIESQRERLSGWTAGFNGKVRYALYNGDTPDLVREADRRAEPQRIHDRTTLRQQPPPILLTNGTMLEYMLVRPEDAPILAASRKLLRYIVIDEAHTYLGSSAAELALLLRRVLLAFDVKAEEVRFVATSATIASGDRARTERDLKAFLAGVAGVPVANISLVTAEREVPSVDPADAVHGAAHADAGIAALRSTVSARRAIELTDLRPLSSKGSNRERDQDVLGALDRAHGAVAADGTSLLPLKGHFHARGLPGVWACLRRDCAGRAGTLLDSDKWPWGGVSLHPRDRCAHCRGLLWPVAVCSTCGHLFLEGEHDHKTQKFTPPDVRRLELLGEDPDTGDDVVDDDEPDEVEAAGNRRAWACIDTRADGTRTLESLDPADGRLGGSGSVRVHIQRAAEGRPHCPRCGVRPPGKGAPFRGLRAGQAFVLGIAMQVALEAIDGQAAAEQRPFGGRRLLTFTDSRQGSARFAAARQAEVERLHVRYLIWNHVRRLGASSSSTRRTELEAEIAALAPHAAFAALAAMLEQKRQELANLTRPRPVPLTDLEAALDQEPTVNWMYDDRRRFPGFEGEVTRQAFPRLLLLRELLRRSKRRASVEAMGLVRMTYPFSRSASPGAWRAGGRTDAEWHDFLRMLLDIFVRQYVGVEVPERWIRWMGVPFRPSWLQPPGAPADQRNRLLRWPWPGVPREGLVLRLLRASLGLGRDAADDDTVRELMEQAWRTLVTSGVIQSFPAGLRLDLLGAASLESADRAYLCPLTGAVSDVLIGGLSPFVPDINGERPPAPREVAIPTPPFIFRRGPDGRTVSFGEARAWLEADPAVRAARDAGLWSEFHDRLVLGADLYFIREHSAQLDSTKLRRHIELFQERRINVLSCSTTMEMGVDLDALPAVMMNNVPPGPSNYLQRAGRSGRRDETAALALTVARALPHDHHVFRHPMWAFTTPIYVPEVALDRPVLVQRHVNARALQAFLAQAGGNALKLTCAGFFFDGSPSAAERFLTWLSGGAEGDPSLAADLARLVRRTALEGWSAAQLLRRVADAFLPPLRRLSLERQALVRELEDLPPGAPALVAVRKQLQRLEGEYLLGHLAGEQILPGNGIPTDVVPFVNLTIDELKARESAKAKKPALTERPPDDRRRLRARAYPSYEAAKALRAYTPGRAIVIDGLAYTSRGVTLNWKRPPLDGSAPAEVQSIRWASRCRVCGTATVAQQRPAACPACLGDDLDLREFLEPAGFTVDIGEHPTTELPTESWAEPRPAWVSAGTGPFEGVGGAGVAELRWAPDGLVFHYADGDPNLRLGYAVCLHCGRAAPHDDPNTVPPGFDDHRRLRRIRPPEGEEPECPGAGSSFGIKRGLLFGAEVRTEVFELRLQPPGVEVSRAAATSVAVALRSALGEAIGVETEEIGYAVTSRRVDGEKRYTLALFDTAAGGAGFVGEAPPRIASLLHAARVRLAGCTCDRACEQCLLDYGTQFDLEHLDRHAALAVLTPDLVTALALPPELRFPGCDTTWEWEAPGRGLLREARRVAAKRIRVHLHGVGADGDIAAWSTHPLLAELQRFDGSVEVVLPEGRLATLRDDERAVLAGLSRAPLSWRILVGNPSVPAASGTRVWAEADGKDVALAFAGGPTAEVCAGDRWLAGQGWVVGKGRGSLPDLPATPAAALASTGTAGWREITVRDELDGQGTEVGRRLLDLLVGDAPEAAGLGPAASVEVHDRYLRRPGPLANLRSVVSDLARREWIGSSTSLVLTTVRANEVRAPTLREHEWNDTGLHEAVVASLFADIDAFMGRFVPWPTDMPHHREIALAWPSGRRLRVRIDQGFGIVGPERGSFPFGAEPEAQADALRKAAWSCARVGGFGTSVYVRWEDA